MNTTPTHTTTITDISEPRPGGYGPLGHGIWKITCSCGWSTTTNTGGRNAARRVESDHIGWEASIKRLAL